MPKKILVVTRKSELALKQTELAIEYLAGKLPEVEFQIVSMSTTGDRDQHLKLGQSEHRGIFVKELELALLGGTGDIAVHSAKDIPTILPQGLEIAGYLPREEANEVLIYREGAEIKSIATDSFRRRLQLEKFFPNVEWRSMRGNIKTRLEKIANSHADATILAAAGLKRLGISSWPKLAFKKYTLEEIIPAPGQGAIAIECRKGETAFWSPLLDPQTFFEVEKERQLLSEAGGGCGSGFAAHVRGNSLLFFKG